MVRKPLIEIQLVRALHGRVHDRTLADEQSSLGEVGVDLTKQPLGQLMVLQQPRAPTQSGPMTRWEACRQRYAASGSRRKTLLLDEGTLRSIDHFLTHESGS
jgi:hypothetical protein